MRLAGMMEKLVVYPDRMLANLEILGGVVHAYCTGRLRDRGQFDYSAGPKPAFAIRT
jgi:adenylosuccinate lyase